MSIFSTLLRLQTMVLLNNVLVEEFPSKESAIAKYGINPILVREGDDRYQLELRPFQRGTQIYYKYVKT